MGYCLLQLRRRRLKSLWGPCSVSSAAFRSLRLLPAHGPRGAVVPGVSPARLGPCWRALTCGGSSASEPTVRSQSASEPVSLGCDLHECSQVSVLLQWDRKAGGARAGSFRSSRLGSCGRTPVGQTLAQQRPVGAGLCWGERNALGAFPMIPPPTSHRLEGRRDDFSVTTRGAPATETHRRPWDPHGRVLTRFSLSS